MSEVSNMSDILDSRDIQERIEELDEFVNDPESFGVAHGDVDSDSIDELHALKALRDECMSVTSEWEYGVALIRDSYFETYAEELADDIGAVDRNASWPLTHIDWAAAAADLQQDYGQVEFDGITYWVRYS